MLFNYVGLQTVDSLYMIRVCRDIVEGRFAPPFTEARPDTSRRGFISFVFDGRHKFARYYAPDNFNTPGDDGSAACQQRDRALRPSGRPRRGATISAPTPTIYSDLIMQMNALLNRMIAKEVGANDGSFLPAILRDG